MRGKRNLVVLDVDGFLMNSYEVIRAPRSRRSASTSAHEAHFKDRRKLLADADS